MAQAFFNRMNKNKEYEGISAGTNISNEVNPVYMQTMKEIGIDISSHYPKKVNDKILKDAYKILTMGCNVTCDLPAGRKFDDDWNIDDPAGKSVEEIIPIRDSIKNKTLLLIKELKWQNMD